MTARPDTAATLAEQFFHRFPGLPRAHGRYIPTGKLRPKGKAAGRHQTVQHPPSVHLFVEHLAGRYSLGIVPVRDDATCRFGAIDVDRYDLDRSAISADLDRLGLPLVMCDTKSGGVHLYLFCQEDCPAELVRGKLMDWAQALGFSGAEIFPKQSRLANPTDTGNWINMPYFGGTARQCWLDGNYLPPDVFVRFAAAKAVTTDELRDLVVEASPLGDLLYEAPPCLQCLARQGIQEGQRNIVMFNMALYCKKRHDEAMADPLDQINVKLVDPPLGHQELSKLAKTVLRKDYNYQCKEAPLAQVCSRDLCLTRRFGVASEGVDRPIENKKALLTEFNERYSAVQVGNKGRVIDKTQSPSGGLPPLLPAADFKFMHRHRHVKAGSRTVDAGSWWLSHPERSTLPGGIGFFPGEHDTPGVYNLWQGWGVEPQEGDCSLVLLHVHEVIANGNPDHAAWVLGWLAHLVQSPMRKLGTALALVGEPGTGKSLFGEIIGRVLGSSYRKVSHPDHVTGRFNTHLTSTLLLHAEEAFFAGDPRAAGILKDLITSPTMRIEPKGVDSFEVSNYLRLMVMSNEPWVVHADAYERRWAVFELSNVHKQSLPYFAALLRQMEQGGYAAFLHYLLHYPIDEERLRRIPETSALFRQKMHSLKSEEAWLLDLLENGQLPGDRRGTGECPATRLYNHYVSRSGKAGFKRKSIERLVTDFLRRTFGRLEQFRDLVRRTGPDGELVLGPDGEPVWHLVRWWRFPPLNEARAMFAKTVPGAAESWSPGDQWQPDGLDEPKDDLL